MVGGSRTRRRVIVAAVVTGVLAAAGGVAWFQPQKLVIDERVDEVLPSARPASPGPTSPEPASPDYAFGAAALG
jgi:hypothetical protein